MAEDYLLTNHIMDESVFEIVNDKLPPCRN